MLAEKGAAWPPSLREVLPRPGAQTTMARPGTNLPVHRQSRLSRMPVQILQSADFQCMCSPLESCGSPEGLIRCL